MTPTTIQITVWLPPEFAGGWKSPAAKPMATRNSRILAAQLAVDAMAPELTAAAAS
jgi:hypothetical protein